jgi:hypothetical protein
MSTPAENPPLGHDVDTAVRYGLHEVYEVDYLLYRLYMQHWLCTTDTGFIIHPEIPLDTDNLNIADVGCGTGYVGKMMS